VQDKAGLPRLPLRVHSAVLEGLAADEAGIPGLTRGSARRMVFTGLFEPARRGEGRSLAPVGSFRPSTFGAGTALFFGVAGGQDPGQIVLDVEAVLGRDSSDGDAENAPELAERAAESSGRPNAPADHRTESRRPRGR
jgi:hypothetical protein